MVRASSSFLKKRTKKLLIFWLHVAINVHPNEQKFLLLFQKEALSCLLRVNLHAAWYRWKHGATDRAAHRGRFQLGG